ncbi:MAG: hypothetical protein ACKO6B_06420 [Planctomycetia bacterium]
MLAGWMVVIVPLLSGAGCVPGGANGPAVLSIEAGVDIEFWSAPAGRSADRVNGLWEGISGESCWTAALQAMRERMTALVWLPEDEVQCWGTAEHVGATLTATQARRLAVNELGINFPDLVVLEVSAARELAACRGALTFPRLEMLDRRSAMYLGRRSDRLRLDGLPSLDPASARGLSQVAGTLQLSGLARIDVATAESLACHRGPLAMNGLETLDAAVAEALARHDGPLCLNGVTAISDAAAEALSNHRHILALNGLVTLPDEAARSLGRHRGSMLLCDGIRMLGEDSLAALLRHGRHVSLAGLGSRAYGVRKRGSHVHERCFSASAGIYSFSGPAQR